MPYREVESGHLSLYSTRERVNSVRRTAREHGLSLRYQSEVQIKGTTEIPAGHIALRPEVPVEAINVSTQNEPNSVMMGVVKELVL